MRQVAVVEQVYSNQEQTPLIPTPKSILVKKVTFEKGAAVSSSNSSNNSTPTVDLNSYSEQYLDMSTLNTPTQTNFEPFHK